MAYRQHDGRSEREKGMARDQRQQKLQEAFENAKCVLNLAQASAIGALLDDGSLMGTTLPEVEPVPACVAVTGVGARVPPAAGEEVLGSHATVGLMAPDGRTWSVSAGGVCWPGGISYADAVRARKS